jgi:hypothetical protein
MDLAAGFEMLLNNIANILKNDRVHASGPSQRDISKDLGSIACTSLVGK